MTTRSSPASHRILTESVEMTVADGSRMGGFLARPADPGRFPGVVVAMELFGVSAHVRDVCERLAADGYLALAPDLYHRDAPGIELPHDAAGRERGFELLHRMTRDQAVDDVRAAMDHLRARGCARVGMVGLSVGGHVAYLAAARLDLAAVAVAYGGWIPAADIPLGSPEPTLALTPGITGRVLVLVGAEDHVVPPDHRRMIADALRAAAVRHEIVEYPGTGHGFLCDRRDTFDAAAAGDAWRRVRELLAEELVESGPVRRR
ncbi:dienelactone hydrolase family protein [Microbispora rosea]|uniref:dienelactone hydrolase family protein n=1 Tax=Microbispora rosea TaxID=58117 RepID=UPI003424E2B5